MRVVTADVVDVQGGGRRVGEPLKELVQQIDIEAADQAPFELNVVYQARPTGKINDHPRQRFVEWDISVAITGDAGFVADRLTQRLTEYNAHILNGVMRIYLEIAAGTDVEIYETMPGDLIEHVLEEWQPCFELGHTLTIQVEYDCDLGLSGLARDLRGTVCHQYDCLEFAYMSGARRIPPMSVPSDNQALATPRVGLFVTCLVDLFRPNVGFAAVELLEAAGCQVEVPAAQTCCGQPAFNSGDQPDSRAIAEQVIETFEAFDYLVAPSGSCAGMIRTHYAALFKSDPVWHRRACELANKTHELLSFLHDVRGVVTTTASFAETVTYHDSCSGLRELGVDHQPRSLLQQVDGLVLNEMTDTDVCCGFGGTFCVKYPEISERLVSDKLDNIAATGATTVLGGDLGCLLNIAGRLRRLGRHTRVLHAAEVLAGLGDGPGIGDERP